MKGTKKFIIAQLVVLLMFGVCITANAASVIMEGDYVRTAVSDDGTLGYGGTMSPGIQHDTTGTRTFLSDDYLTPGFPWEIFSANSNETGLLTNNNANGFGDDIVQIAITNLNVSSIYDNHENGLAAPVRYR